MPGRQRWWTPWRDMRWAFGAVWLIFLIYPWVAVATGDISTGQKVCGYLLIVSFAVIYVVACVYSLMAREREVSMPFTIGVFGLLTTIGAALLPIIGGGAFGVVPFLMAIAAFTFPPIYGVATVILLIAAAVLVGEWIPDWAVDPGTVVVMVAVGMTLLGIRVLRGREMERDAADERQRELNNQLAVVAERERVARDVHDILGHSLTVITLKSELAQRLVDLDPERARKELGEVNMLSRQALDEVRATVGNLRSPDLASTIAAARSALDAAGIAVSVSSDDRSSTAHDTLFAWLLREAVTNVVRHSSATTCTITLRDNEIEIRDDGHGMNGSGFGNGLRGLAERVEDADGALTVDSAAGGTAVRAVLP
ncbi:sensor histidine kinase [Gordonia hankookensis]|uniref:Sensor histidine kinase n=1 Tax=Gordonia hankookensis TaxID=589403 RepID=A0ABR7WEB6_9ACTN|nr:sensor histidine kinase [Gordonia hankookensis]MBD1321127.1 sensor histidine kinase [Gordonia hankookensis]